LSFVDVFQICLKTSRIHTASLSIGNTMKFRNETAWALWMYSRYVQKPLLNLSNCLHCDLQHFDNSHLNSRIHTALLRIGNTMKFRNDNLNQWDLNNLRIHNQLPHHPIRKITFTISAIINCIRHDKVSSGGLAGPYQTEYGSNFYHQVWYGKYDFCNTRIGTGDCLIVYMLISPLSSYMQNQANSYISINFENKHTLQT
jgi:hypothetical protein